MRRIWMLFAVMLLPLLALGEDAAPPTPPTLPAATSAEEVQSFLLMPEGDTLAGVKRGYIRYIGQNAERDDMYRDGYWLGGEKGSVLDLTLRERYGVKFAFYAGNMCSRAVYSMALSYLGIDVTPGAMSEMMNARNLYEPYDIISYKVGVERIPAGPDAFNTMMNNYLTDDSYSPVYLYIRRPNGTNHALLVVAAIPDKGRFLVVDCNPPRSRGELYRVYFISLNKQRSEIINSTFRDSLKGSQVLQLHQWYLLVDPAEAE